jgi:type I restriction enzyme S subunit
MVIPKGYKKTEIGTIPEDWSIVELGEKTVKVGSGITPTGGERVYKKEGRPFLRSQNVGWGALLLDDLAFIDEETHKSFSSTEITEGDVFLNITGASIGRSAVANRSVIGGNVNQHVCIIRADRLELCPKYLNLFLLSVLGQKQVESFQAGGNRQGLNFAQIKSFKTILPSSISEQTAIATVISDTDSLIEHLDKLISKKKAIKQGTMQKLLTGRERLSGFSGKWEQSTLGELFSFSGGYAASRAQLSEDGFCYLHYGDIHGASKTYIDVDLEYSLIPKLHVPLRRVSSKSLLNDGDVVFVDASEDDEGTSRHIVVRNPKSIPYISGLHTIIAKSKNSSLDNAFKRYCFQTASIRNQFIFYAVGTKVSGISKANITKIELRYPGIEEQAAIAAILSDMDAEIESLEQKRRKYILVKQGMMQQLLTGKIRLI